MPMLDPPGEDTAATVASFHHANISVKMINRRSHKWLVLFLAVSDLLTGVDISPGMTGSSFLLQRLLGLAVT